MSPPRRPSGRVEHEDVAPVAAAPDRALRVRRLQLAVPGDEPAVVVEPGQRVVERAALALVDPDAHPGPRAARRLADAAGRLAREHDGLAEQLREQRRALGRRVRPDPERIAGQERLGEDDEARARGAGLLDEPARLVHARVEVEELGGGVDGGDGEGGLRRHRRSLRRQQPPDLLVGALVEALVPDADGAERVRREHAHHALDLLRERRARLARGDGHGDEHRRGRARAGRPARPRAWRSRSRSRRRRGSRSCPRARPAGDRRGRRARAARARAPRARRSRRSPRCGNGSSRTTSAFRTRTPPDATAPKASSFCHGTPSLRTANASNGTRSSWPTAAATGTPPRARPSTTTSSRPSNAAESRRQLAARVRAVLERPSCPEPSRRRRNVVSGRMRVLVAGGGIGGMAAAIALERAGFDPRVFERAPRAQRDRRGPRPDGQRHEGDGLPRCRRVRPPHRRAGRRDRVAQLDDGSRLFIQRHGAQEKHYGEQYVCLHRADLLASLVREVPEERVRLNSQAGRVRRDARRRHRALRGRALRGGRPARRRGRAALDRPVAALRRAGGTLHGRRGVARAHPRREHAAGLRRADRRVVRPRPALHDLSGRATTSARSTPSSPPRRSTRRRGGHRATSRTCAARSQTPSPPCSASSTASPRCSSRRSTSATRCPCGARTASCCSATPRHPAPSSAGQGAAMALEDALMLAGCLGRDPLPAALADYASRRRPRTSPMLVTARSNLAMFNEPDPRRSARGTAGCSGMLRLDPLGESSIGWLYGHDPVAAAAEPVAPTPPEEGRLRRPEAQRAADLWRGAITLEDRAGLWRGERAGYERFIAGSTRPSSRRGPRPRRAGGAARRGRGPRRPAPPRRRLHDGVRARRRPLAARLAQAAGGWALVPDYRLAPEHPFPAAPRTSSPRTAPSSARASSSPASAPVAASRSRSPSPRATRGSRLPEAIDVVSPFCDLTLVRRRASTRPPGPTRG